MSTRLLPTKSIDMKASQTDLLLLKSYQLNLNLSDQSNSPKPSNNPFSPESFKSPQTPQMIRQRSTSFRNATNKIQSKPNSTNNVSIPINQSVKNNPKSINVNISYATKEQQITDSQNTPINTDSDLSNNDNENDGKSDKQFLYENGYELKKKIDTSQGCIYEAIIISNNTKVAIKKAAKSLYSKGICIENNMNIITHENIIKEAMILHHLTIDNQPTADYIAKFINFVENDNNFFLIMEYCGNVTLKEFCETAFNYVKEGKLNVKEYKRIMKYLFWQISVVLYWMNNDMQCCHLNLNNMENIMVQNGTFIENDNGTIEINQEIFLKINHFGLAEIFKVKKHKKNHKDETKEEEYVYNYEYDPYEVDWNNNENNPYFCKKFGIKNGYQYCAPQIWLEEPYNAQKSDAWDMGIILFKLITGVYPYTQADSSKDNGYWCIENGNIKQCLEINNLLQYVNGNILNLLNGLLNMDENDRFNSNDIIHHTWFKSYYAKYKDRIESKSIEQKQKRKQQKKKMKVFPYYNINENCNANIQKHSSKSLI